MPGGVEQFIRDLTGWEPSYTGTVLQTDCTETHATAQTTRHQTSHRK